MGKTMNSCFNNGDNYLVDGLEHEFSHLEFHNPNWRVVRDFSEGLVAQPPTSLLSRVIWDNYTLIVNS